MSTASATTAAAPARPSAWAPFGHRTFAVLWLATLLSNVGTWMHDVGAAWLMTELSPSPLMVAAVQAATTAPIFLFALVAGAIADIVDRRLLLVAVNAVMLLTAAVLAGLVAFDMVTPPVLLAVTFVLGTCAAFTGPTWQSIVPSLVPRAELAPAIALNSLGINVSRAIGPALAGFLIAGAGLWSPFALNALSFLGIILALWWWRPAAPPASKLPPEEIGAAIVAGLRYASNSGPVRSTLIRALAFFLFASAFWAMMPLVARTTLAGGAALYGLLMAAVGVGAVFGAFVLPWLRSTLGSDRLVASGTAGTATALVLLAVVPSPAVALGAAALAGLSWISVVSSLNLSVQTALPDWVRARGLSIFLTVFFGAMTAGSLLWGQVASHWGIPAALIAAALGAVAFVPLTWSAKLNEGNGRDLAPSMHWADPIVAEDLSPGGGPVMIQVAYDVGPAEQARFVALMRECAAMRRRGGGYRWSLMQDSADASRFVETWMESSWLQHLRHHDRVTGADRDLQVRIHSLLSAGTKPVVTHYVSPSEA